MRGIAESCERCDEEPARSVNNTPPPRLPFTETRAPPPRSAGQPFPKNTMTKDEPEEAKAGDEEDQRTEATVQDIELDELTDATAGHVWMLRDLMPPKQVARLGPRVDAAIVALLRSTPEFDDLEAPDRRRKGVPAHEWVEVVDDVVRRSGIPGAFETPRLVSADSRARSRGDAASHPRKSSSPRRRRDSSPRTLHARSRGVAASPRKFPVDTS